VPNYLDYLYRFEVSSLKGYLGENLVDTLIEWMPEGNTLLTRQILIKMIDSLHGTNILKNKNFRKDLLLSMGEDDILEIRENEI